MPFLDLLSAVQKSIPVFTLFKHFLLTPEKVFLHFISLCYLLNLCKFFPLFIVIDFASQNSMFVFLGVLVVFHLCLLRYSPQQKSCWSCRQLLCVIQFFLSPLFLCFFNLEFRNLLLSVSSVLFCSSSCPSLYSFLLFSLLSVLFSPTAYSLYFLTSLIFFSNLLSFLFAFLITLFCLLLPYVLLLFNLFSFY